MCSGAYKKQCSPLHKMILSGIQRKISKVPFQAEVNCTSIFWKKQEQKNIRRTIFPSNAFIFANCLCFKARVNCLRCEMQSSIIGLHHSNALCSHARNFKIMFSEQWLALFVTEIDANQKGGIPVVHA